MANFQDWYNSIVGHQFDGDADGSFDCVDVAESYCKFIWPQNNWSVELGYGNAKDLYNAANPNYFKKINYSAGLVPLQGDIIVYGATPTNPYGHIAVVVSATASSVTVVQENSYTQQAAYVGTLGYSYCLGFLRVKGADMLTPAQVNQLCQIAFNRPAHDDEKNVYSSIPTEEALQRILDGAENLGLRTAAQAYWDKSVAAQILQPGLYKVS